MSRYAPLSTLLSLIALACCAAGCARHARPRDARSVAIVAVDTLGVAPDEGTRLQRALQREASRRPGAAPATPERVARAFGPDDRPATRRCRESDSCLAGVGRRVPADLVLTATLAGLGDMRLVRARLVRSSDALVVHDLQRTISGRASALEQVAADLSRRLFPHEGSSWYRRWWVWAAVASVTGATVGLTWWLASDRGEPDRDPNVKHLGDL